MSKAPQPIRLRSSTIWSLASQVISAIVTLVVGIVIARSLGPESKGALSIAQQAVSLLLVILGLGVPTASTYFLASKQVDPREVVGNVIVQSGLAFLVSIGALSVVLLTSDIPREIAPALITSSSLYFLFLFLTTLLSGVAHGIEGLKRASLSSIISSVLLLVLVVAGEMLGVLTVSMAMFMSAISALVGLIFVLIVVWPYLREMRVRLRAWKQMATYSFKSFLGAAAGMLHARQDLLMIGWLLTASAAGIYSVGVSFAELIWFLPTALGTAVLVQAPRHQHENALDFSARSSRISIILTLLVTLALAVVVPWALPVLFGVDFSAGTYVFFALLPGAVSDGVLRVINNYALSINEICWQEQLVGVAVNLALVFLIAKPFGIVGVALGSSISYTLVLVLITLRLRRRNIAMRQFLVPQWIDVTLLFEEAKDLCLRRK